ncbi:MAG: toluene tolerance protein [Methylotenera sp.]|nr:toluene tolerance protein [Methylotenera sp.]
MIASLNKWIRPSLLLTHDTFDQMISGGEVLEQDERGYKVIKLSSGDILKVFRLRRQLSGARIYSNARKFARNAERLKALGVNTVHIKQLYHFEHSTNTAVLYSPLVGFTLKKLLEGDLLNQEMVFELGRYVATLHQLGIHFRSLHMGNIVITPEGEYGLIDISDMSIYPWPLFGNTRARNFKHLTRYPDDIIKLGESSWESFKEGYLSNAKLNETCKSKLRSTLDKSVSFN